MFVVNALTTSSLSMLVNKVTTLYLQTGYSYHQQAFLLEVFQLQLTRSLLEEKCWNILEDVVNEFEPSSIQTNAKKKNRNFAVELVKKTTCITNATIKRPRQEHGSFFLAFTVCSVHNGSLTPLPGKHLCEHQENQSVTKLQACKQTTPTTKNLK